MIESIFCGGYNLNETMEYRRYITCVKVSNTGEVVIIAILFLYFLFVILAYINYLSVRKELGGK